jgi:hypothetical protein
MDQSLIWPNRLNSAKPVIQRRNENLKFKDRIFFLELQVRLRDLRTNPHNQDESNLFGFLFFLDESTNQILKDRTRKYGLASP